MIEATLKELDGWFNDGSAIDEKRSKLLCKLALLELCGWIEVEFDRLIREAEIGRLNDAAWCNENVIKVNFGFHYKKHLRRMFTQLFGEVFARRVESEMDAAYPGERERMAALLGTLWEKRCAFAHEDYAASIATQKTFDAPSWSIAQYKTLVGLFACFERSVASAIPVR